MLKLSKSKLFLLFILIVAIIILVLSIPKFLQQETKETYSTQNPVTNDNLSFFKSNISDISFYYPKNFYTFEDGDVITISPFTKNDQNNQESSIGIASNLTIILRKNESFLSNSILTQNYDSREFREEKTTYKDKETVIQSYRGDYANEMNYVMLVNYKNISSEKSDLFYLHYTEKNKDVYEKVIDSITFNTN